MVKENHVPTVVVIEDQDIVLNVLSHLLKDHGINAVGFSSGAEGLQYVLQNKVNLVILDFMLPDIRGNEICKRIKEVHDIPVVILTGYPTIEKVMLSRSAGADDFVSKIGFATPEFVEKIKGYIEGSEKSGIQSDPNLERILTPENRQEEKNTDVEPGSSHSDIARVRAKLKENRVLRSLPFITIEIARTASEAESSARDLLVLLNKDQSLSYKILKIANAAIYGSA